MAAALMPSLPLELAVLVPLGLAMITFQATANSLLQLNSDPEFRGRVMALYVIVFVGSTPIGGPTVGWVAQHFGARAGLGLGGAATLVGALLALWAVRRWKLGVRGTDAEARPRAAARSVPTPPRVPAECPPSSRG